MNKEQMFQLLNEMAAGIASVFGRNCETLIQDLSLDSHPILAIYNGHVSGREVGSIVDIFGHSTGITDRSFLDQHYVNTLVERNGKKIKSTTFNIKGEDYHYGFGINYDFTAISSVQDILGDLATVGSFLDTAIGSVRQTRLEDVFKRCIAQIGKPAHAMKRNDRIQLIRLLKKEHALNYQKSIPYISEQLGVSRYTIYNYLKVVEQQEASEIEQPNKQNM